MTTTNAARQPSRLLFLGALGVVYGDLGTSPLYAFEEAFNPLHLLAVTPANIYGILSLILWALVLIPTLKYATFALRADNGGEGGIFPLMALVLSRIRLNPHWRRWAIIFGLVGAAMFYGDSTITPAISVLSAVEGLEVLSPHFGNWIVPLTVVILGGLFWFQHRGTTQVGQVFGPIMFLWFMTLGILGAIHIFEHPTILNALNPWWGVELFRTHPSQSLFLLGVVFLALTGAEAMYADMGHLGIQPIRLAWYRLVFPALALNYLGQGAFILKHPAATHNLFFHLVPAAGVLPLVILSTLATVIASQAVISGAFSMTAAAIKLGYLPRLRINVTDDHHRGQIYIPVINWLLLVTVVLLVITFRSSSQLSGAYGLAVNLTMVVTTFYLIQVARHLWRWSMLHTSLVWVSILVIEIAFLLGNALKIPHGGWYSLVFGGIIYVLLVTWRQGQVLLRQQLLQANADFSLKELLSQGIARVPGVAVFFSPLPQTIPPTFIQNLQHNHVLHQQIFFIHLATADRPYVPLSEQLTYTVTAVGICQIVLTSGFRDRPDVLLALETCQRVLNLPLNEPMSFFVGRRTIIPTPSPGMTYWQKVIFAWLHRNAEDAMTYFRLPPQQVVELGMRVEI
ncbi:KUP/HAK/KT family potassium transporter [Thermosynechococcus sp. HN-54]|uniref:potassium transporter Kup n=1 Tax=Thermosynechococcus sp. HN-54 TaxID=2933959 RepID=UPI00202CF85E|nr:KUP/HAK/KT family potassium transporter [Thermosynechococcus sp. HN-54]URR34384.1 KUP/HAK/KT family potassium transporter [Thermosynechococcus sp. HN-54]